MLTVKCSDGAVFTGSDEKAIVRAMKHTDWHAPERKGEYMEDVAARIDMMTGQKIRVSSPKAFLKDLQAVGFLTVSEADSTPSAHHEGSAGAPSDSPS
jgi:hypothetical protein